MRRTLRGISFSLLLHGAARVGREAEAEDVEEAGERRVAGDVGALVGHLHGPGVPGSVGIEDAG